MTSFLVGHILGFGLRTIPTRTTAKTIVLSYFGVLQHWEASWSPFFRILAHILPFCRKSISGLRYIDLVKGLATYYLWLDFLKLGAVRPTVLEIWSAQTDGLTQTANSIRHCKTSFRSNCMKSSLSFPTLRNVHIKALDTCVVKNIGWSGHVPLR